MAFVEETSVNRAAYVKRSRKHRYIKPFALLLSAVLLCGMVGCSKSGTSSPGSSFGDSRNISADNSIEDFKPVSVPEGGWTAESVIKTICIDGKLLEYPFTIGRLGNDFTINENNTQIFESGAASTILYKDDIPILTIEFQNITNYNQINSAKPHGFSSYYKDSSSIEDDISKVVSINGVRLGASKSEIELVFGTPDSISDHLLSYIDRNTNQICVGFWLNDNDELYSFSIILDYLLEE